MAPHELQQIRERLDQLERRVGAIEGSVHLIEVEQTHVKELFESRLKGIEKGQEIAGLKLDTLVTGLTAFSTEPDKSPMGRAMISHINGVTNDIDGHRKILDNVLIWQNRVDGVLLLLKWLGASGVIGLAITLIRMVIEMNR